MIGPVPPVLDGVERFAGRHAAALAEPDAPCGRRPEGGELAATQTRRPGELPQAVGRLLSADRPGMQNRCEIRELTDDEILFEGANEVIATLERWFQERRIRLLQFLTMS